MLYFLNPIPPGHIGHIHPASKPPPKIPWQTKDVFVKEKPCCWPQWAWPGEKRKDYET